MTTEPPVDTLAKSAQRLLAALQADGGTPQYAVREELERLVSAAQRVLNYSAFAQLSWSPTDRDVAAADLLANPPVYVPSGVDEMTAISDRDRMAALEVCAALSMLDTTPPEVDLAAQQLTHYLGGSTAPFRPLPPRS